MLREQKLRKIFYDKIDPRRRQELADSNMIREAPHEMANLSRKAIHREYDSHKFDMSELFDDEVGAEPLRFGNPYDRIG